MKIDIYNSRFHLKIKLEKCYSEQNVDFSKPEHFDIIVLSPKILKYLNRKSSNT